MGNLTSSGKPRASNGFLLVHVRRADKEIGRQQGGHSVEPSGNGGGLQPHAARPARKPQPLWSYWEERLDMPMVVQQRK